MDQVDISSVVVLLVALAAAAVLLHPRVLASPVWRATITPLASIIGSGFLVLAPILVRHFGHGAALVMALLCLAAYAIGGAIRWNIRALDTETGVGALRSHELLLERFSSLALLFAYVVSVCYYLNLFGAFATSLTPYADPTAGRLVTSCILVFVGLVGWTRGFHGLENMEVLSVGLKLAVIVALLVGMGGYTFRVAEAGLPAGHHESFGVNAVRMAFGLLITVQGFETSRYLASSYDARTRVTTMRYAQLLSTAIYIAYIGMASLAFAPDDIETSETAIIHMSGHVALIMPFLLVLAALASQFSAAVADTGGYGGLAEEVSGGRLRTRMAYALLVPACIALTWVANIYEIISYASRAFAFYYGSQCAFAAMLSRRVAGWTPATVGFTLLTVLALAVGFLGIPVETANGGG
ncbi:MAG: hypothetical protein H6993_06645 [Pseudomonadales bacterium]|nr:hypothetical protein [Pseudomonadales bacterium]MCP5183624.1 hypothetical protein [Pseudomonadales bacterium]